MSTDWNAAIEEAAKVAERYPSSEAADVPIIRGIAQAIRALKSSTPTSGEASAPAESGAGAKMREFAPCPTCGQYSHTIREDQLSEAFMHFETMFSHRGDGIPTQFVFDQKTRDAAQVLMAAASPTPAESGAGADVERVQDIARAAYVQGYGDGAEDERLGGESHPDTVREGFHNFLWSDQYRQGIAALASSPTEQMLREALEPFALVSDLIDSETEGFDDSDELNLIIESGHLLDRFTVGHFRRARQALQAGGE